MSISFTKWMDEKRKEKKGGYVYTVKPIHKLNEIESAHKFELVNPLDTNLSIGKKNSAVKYRHHHHSIIIKKNGVKSIWNRNIKARI